MPEMSGIETTLAILKNGLEAKDLYSDLLFG